jgi:hypothetical protein
LIIAFSLDSSGRAILPNAFFLAHVADLVIDAPARLTVPLAGMH